MAYCIKEDVDSGKSCKIIITMMAPMIKSRASDLKEGFFSSKKYVLPAPILEITTPPMIIPGTRAVVDILGVKKEKKGRRATQRITPGSQNPW